MPSPLDFGASKAAIAFCVLLALAAWLPAGWRAGFALDDREVVLENPLVTGALPWTAAFERDYFHHLGDVGQWRPLATLSFRVEASLWRALGVAQRPWPWHLANVGWHALAVWLAGLLLAGLALSRARGPVPWFGLALFAAHPALADSVAWISGRTSMVAAASGLVFALGLQAALRRGREQLAALCALLGVLAAMAAKEDGVVFACAYPLLARASSTRAAWRVAVGSALGVLLALAARAWALDELLPSARYPVLPGAGLLERMELGGVALVEALRLAVAPFGYPPQYRVDFLLARPVASELVAALGWTLYLTAVGLSLARLARGGGRVPASALLAALALAPALHLVPIGEAFAPRFLYLPLLFAAPIAQAVWRALPARNALAALALALCVVGAWQRAGVYADRESYRRETLRHQPDDAPSWNDLGLALEERGELDAARAAWERATRLRPAYSRAWSNLGRMHDARGELEQAERCYRRAAAVGEGNAVAQANLGAFLLRTDRAAAAVRAYERAIEAAPGRALGWRGLGAARLQLDEPAAAVAALERALELDPADGRARRLLERALDAPR